MFSQSYSNPILAESTLPTSIYSSTPFNYSPHPPGLFFGWNNNNHSSLLRTHSASYQDYPGSSIL